MGLLQQLFQELKNLLTWWCTITPWEEGIRVRRGKIIKILGPGMHWVIPLFDKLYIQTNRLRFCDLPVQTLTTADGHTVTLKGMLGYKIINIQRLYDRLQHPESALVELVTSAIADYVNTHDRGFTPGTLAQEMNLDFNKYGIGGVQFRITDFAYVRAYRIINADTWYSDGDKL